MKRTIAAFLMIWILAVSVCGTALSAFAAENAESLTASSAQEEQTQAAPLSDTDTAAELELFLPESYEQYLELENPSDFAINDSYIAVADKSSNDNSCIYILNRTAENAQYYRYVHNSNNVLSSLNFYEADGKTFLFFLETGGTLYYIDCSAPETASQIEQISPYSIIFSGNDVYYASATDASANIFHTTVSASGGQITIAQGTQLNQIPYSTSRPVFSSYRGTVYFAAGREIYTCSPTDEPRERFTVNYSVYNFSITGTNDFDLIYISMDNYLYFRNSDTQAEPRDLNYTGVRLDESANLAYIVTSAGRILRYDLNAGSFDNYEIAHYSDSDNRIGDSQDVSVYGGKVVIADTGNERIVLHSDGNYTTFDGISANFVCAGSENFLAVTNTEIYLYDYGGGAPTAVDGISARTVAAAAYSYGYYYLISTDGSSSSTYEVDAATGQITRSGSIAPRTSVTDIAADLFGNIYVLSSGYVNKYTGEQFFAAGNPETVAEFSTATIEIVVDYAGNLYGLTENTVCAGGSSTAVNLDFSTIAYSNEAKQAVSFTFDIESGDMYILSDGFIAKADLGANAPSSLNSIAADGLYASLHGAPSGEDDAKNMLVSVPAGSVLLPVADTGSITESTDIFPYTSFSRTEEARTGVRVCELAAGTVVAFYRYAPSTEEGIAPTREYTLALVLDGDLSAIGGYTEETPPYTGYTTNEVGLYRFPLLRTGGETIYSNDATRLSRSTRVAVYGTLQSLADENAPGYGLDFDYYFVAATIDGETVYGFIPTNYVLNYDASASWEGTEFTFRNVARGETITLYSGEQFIELSDEEQVKVFGEPNAENLVYVTYTDESGTVWSGQVDADLLYEAGPSTLVILAVVAVVTAAVLLSTCYLILRKQPTMQ